MGSLPYLVSLAGALSDPPPLHCARWSEAAWARLSTACPD